MADFSVANPYSESHLMTSVVFGANAIILETELNEAQSISSGLIKKLVKTSVGDGIGYQASYIGNTAGQINLNGTEIVSVAGFILPVSFANLTYGVSAGSYVFGLKVSEVSLTKDSTLYDNSGATYTNYLLDSRIQEESTRRTGLSVSILCPVSSIPSDSGSDHYLKLGNIYCNSVNNNVTVSMCANNLFNNQPQANVSRNLYLYNSVSGAL